MPSPPTLFSFPAIMFIVHVFVRRCSYTLYIFIWEVRILNLCQRYWVVGLSLFLTFFIQIHSCCWVCSLVCFFPQLQNPCPRHPRDTSSTLVIDTRLPWIRSPPHTHTTKQHCDEHLCHWGTRVRTSSASSSKRGELPDSEICRYVI